MDIDDFRLILESSGVDVWTFIDTAIVVASLDFGSELKRRRDDIVERLFASSSSCSRCRDRSLNDINMNNTSNGDETKGLVEKESSHEEEKGTRVAADSPVTPRSVNGDGDGDGDGDELDPYGGLFDDEPKKILVIKQQLEDIDQVLALCCSLLFFYWGCLFLWFDFGIFWLCFSLKIHWLICFKV